ncbi:MAG TPA: DUF4082 domain-containing protein [Thermoanaerobaculia bacterium]|jgi:hypothetical protein|nr:DUF4082 domain-containing protein [Thermoanaerobaculia bacterium]
MRARNLSRLAATVAGIAAAAAFASPSASFGYRMIQVLGNGRWTEGAPISCDTAGGFAHRGNGLVSWYLNTNLQGANKDNNIAPAMTAWNNVSGNPYLNYYAGTTTDAFTTDGRNTMVWQSNGSCSGNCLALTALVIQSRQLIVETDITFNNGVAWHTNLDDYDVQTVTAHELGHSMGIHHTEVSTSPLPTMRTPYFGTDGRTLEADDRAAIACLANWYGSPTYDSLHETPTTCAQTKGWIWNSKVPNGDVSVEIWGNSSLLSTIPASTCRPDLAGKGDGCHAFNFVPKAINIINNGNEWIIRAKNALTGQDLNGTGHSLYCATNVFTSQTPSEFNFHTGQSWTVGNEISSSRDGLITHLRYYRSPNETGIHTLKLYTAAGGQLASVDVDFGPFAVARWEVGPLSTPVAITADTRYVITVTTTNQQSKTPCGISPAITRGPLTAWGGRYIQGTAFPTNGSCSNFWTDVYFNQ